MGGRASSPGPLARRERVRVRGAGQARTVRLPSPRPSPGGRGRIVLWLWNQRASSISWASTVSLRMMSRATDIGNLKRRGPALPGFKNNTPCRLAMAGW
jgi:hypothetical protein